MPSIHKLFSTALFLSLSTFMENYSYAMESEQTGIKASCAPKRLTHENLRAIFTPTEEDFEKIETEKGYQKRVKTRVDIRGTSVEVYCAPKTFKAEDISKAIEGNPGKTMMGQFIDYMMKERADHTLAQSKMALDKAAIAGYKLYWVEGDGRNPVFDVKKAEGNIEDPNLVYIAFATKAEWLPADEIPAATRAFKTLDRDMLLRILQGGDQPVSFIGPNKEGKNVIAYYKAKVEDRDRAKIPAIIKLLEEAPAGVELFAKPKTLYAAGASDTMTAVSGTPHEGEDWVYQLYSKKGDEKQEAVKAPEDIKSSAEKNAFSKLRLTFYKPTKKN
jgi:hypothetical protein